MNYDNNNNVYYNVYTNTQLIYIQYYIIAHNSYMYYNNEGVPSQVHVYYTIYLNV